MKITLLLLMIFSISNSEIVLGKGVGGLGYGGIEPPEMPETCRPPGHGGRPPGHGGTPPGLCKPREGFPSPPTADAQLIPPVTIPVPGVTDIFGDSHIMNILCPRCYLGGFVIMPMFSLDYDRDRYIVYLGSDEVVDDEFSKVTGTFSGPFEVVEYGRFFGGVGPMLGFGPFQLGLGVSGSRGYQSARIATNYAEAKAMKRLKKFPKTMEDFVELPNRTQIVTTLSGGVFFLANSIPLYAIYGAGEIQVSGEWVVGLLKKSPYTVQLFLSSTKIGSLRALTGVPFTAAMLGALKKKTVSFSFEINLNEQAGIDAFELFFKGRISRLQTMAQTEKQIRQFGPSEGKTEEEEHEHTKEIRAFQEDEILDTVDFGESNEPKKRQYKGVVELKGVAFPRGTFKGLMDSSIIQTSFPKKYYIGVPFLATALRDFGSKNYFSEKIRFLSDQDVTQIGPVVKDTQIHTLRGTYERSKSTYGLLSKHQMRKKEFQIKMENIIFPQRDIKDNFAWAGSFQRMYMEYHYLFQRNKLKTGSWDREIKMLARRIGHKEGLLENIPVPLSGDVKIPFVALESTIKVSYEAIVSLMKRIEKEGKDEMIVYLKRRALSNVAQWFLNPNNQEGELCDLPVNCKARIKSNTRKGIKVAIQSLLKGKKTFDKLLKVNSRKLRKQFLKDILGFGAGFTVNQFTIGAFLKEFRDNRREDKKNDFTFCVRWKGSSFKSGEYVIDGSILRTDRGRCFLVEEKIIDKVSEKHDKDLFGPSSILEDE